MRTLIILLLMPVIGLSQSIKLDSVLIRADRLEAELGEHSKSITVLDQRDIERLPVNTLDDILRSLAGVNTNQRGPFGVQSDIGMRGSTFSQVLILIDGVRQSDPLTGHFNNNIPLPLAAISRIEIIRGPSSVAYGSDAMGGIIHIHTKAFNWDGEKTGDITRGEVVYGEENLLMTDIGIQFNNNTWFVSGGVKQSISDGQAYINPNAEAGISDNLDKESFFDLRSYTAAITHILNDEWRVSGRFAYDERDFDAQYFYTSSSFDESEEETDMRWGQLSLRRIAERSNTEIWGGYRRGSDLFTFNPAFTPNEHLTDHLSTGVDHSFRINEKAEMAVGGMYRYRSIESNDRGDHEDGNIGAYLLFSHFFGVDSRVTAGARFEHDDSFGSVFTPQLGFTYSPGSLALRMEVGQSIRAADFTERFVSFNIPSLSYGRNLGNPDLDAEQSMSYSLGGTYYWNKGTFFSLDGFYRENDDLIDFAPTLSSDIATADNIIQDATYLYARNISSVDVLGIEASLSRTWTFGDKGSILLRGSATWLEIEIPDDQPSSKYVANSPTWDINGTLHARYGRFGLAWLFDWIDRDEEVADGISALIPSSYSIHNVELRVEVHKGSQVFIRVHNLMDEQYQEILGSRMPGRWVMGGFRWNLKQSE
jgi:iron complex outermembrane receptor protein